MTYTGAVDQFAVIAARSGSRHGFCFPLKLRLASCCWFTGYCYLLHAICLLTAIVWLSTPWDAALALAIVVLLRYQIGVLQIVHGYQWLYITSPSCWFLVADNGRVSRVWLQRKLIIGNMLLLSVRRFDCSCPLLVFASAQDAGHWHRMLVADAFYKHTPDAGR